MLEVLGQATLRTLFLAAIVQLGLGLLRTKRPQLRLIAWTVVLAVSLAMPALQWATPFRLSVLPSLPGAALIEAADPQRQASTFEAFMPAPAEEVTTPITAMPWLKALYLLICGTLLLRLTVGIALSLRLLRKAAPIHLDWAADTNIRISRDVVAPVTVANVILLPSDVVNWSAAMREAVLAHERAHIARWDFAMLLASQVNRAVFWFSPLSWWLHRRLATLAELASDDQAMEATGDRPGYAEVLLEMGRRSGPPLRGLAMARPATLRFRIERILSDRVTTTSVSPTQQMIFAVGAACLSIVAASSRPNSAPSLELVPSAEQRQSLTSAEPDPSPPAPAGADLPEPMPVHAPRTEVASPAPPKPVPVTPAATPSYPPAVRRVGQPIARLTTRNTRSLPPSRTLLQRIRTERDQGTHDASLKAGVVISADFAPRSNEGHGITNSVGGAAGLDGPAPPAHQTGYRPASEPPLLKRMDEPSCTGVYLPRPGGLRADGSVDFVQAKYFQEADGTPWLKLFLGARTRAKLTGFEVERNSVRTTVVTTLPRGTKHVTGTTHGTYGTIDFECVASNAHL